MKHIVVLGSASQDHTVLSPRLPEVGETVKGSKYVTARGGKGANQAVAAARLGGDVTFIACMGNDSFAHEAISAFRKDGINTDHIHLSDDDCTGIALILVDDQGCNCISVAPNANNNMTPERVNDHNPVISEADYLLLQLETPLNGVEKAVELAKEHGVKVVLNPAPARALSDELLSCIDLITPNETEAELLSGVKITDEFSARQAAEYFVDKGVKQVVITLGSHGAYVYENGGGELIPCYKVAAVDTTAAGDTFNGALLVGLSRDMSMDEAIRFAHKACAVSVTRMGAQTSIPYINELSVL
ncbi:Ribokinase [invertebrate metagenome]|uniref:Ribokinase n=1 Tax=invertebrate metagenome TaxID=1711999 RepID=A0A2H9T345_9ZZZZ